jgi:tetratricopeptide (TPR) repeat protein
MAYGTDAGGTIPLRDDKGQLLEYLKDRKNNQPVLTKIQDKALKLITEECAGEIYYASGGLSAWNKFEKDLSNLKRASKEAGSKLDQEERFQWPLLLGFLILLFEFWVPELRWPWAKTLLMAVMLAFGFKSPKALAFDARDPRLVQRNNAAAKPFEAGDFAKSEKALNRALEIDANNRQLRTNWATNKIFQSLLDEGKVDPVKLKAAQGEFESLIKSSKSPTEKALLDYQMGIVNELQNKIPEALSHYYSVLLENHDDLGTKAKTNISRLLTQQESQKGQSGSQGQDPQQGQDGKDQQPKDGEQASQQKQKPRYSGTDLSENEAKQILESVGGEERDVQKRKARAESREKGARKGQERGNGDGSSNPW